MLAPLEADCWVLDGDDVRRRLDEALAAPPPAEPG